jgi:hypothetical protein
LCSVLLLPKHECGDNLSLDHKPNRGVVLSV